MDCSSLAIQYAKQESRVNLSSPGPTHTGAPGAGPCGPGHPDNIPLWACGFLTLNDISSQIEERPILTPDYVGNNIYNEVLVADKFKENNRMYKKAGLDYPYPSTDYGDVGYERDRQIYEGSKNEDWKRNFIDTKYPHKTIYDETGVQYKIPNPYRAKAIRDQYKVTNGQVTFASPNTNPYSIEVSAANSALVEAFAFDSLLFDKDMTNAFLASLWHCENQIQGGEKCIPNQVVMRLREFEQFKNQGAKAAAVQDLRGWPTLARYLETALRMMESLDMPRASAATPISVSKITAVTPNRPAAAPTMVPKPAAPAPAPKPLGPKPAAPPVSPVVPLTGLVDRLKRLKGFGPYSVAKPPVGFGPQLRYIVPVSR